MTESDKAAIETAKKAAEDAAETVSKITNSPFWRSIVDAQRSLQEVNESVQRFSGMDSIVLSVPEVRPFEISSLEEQSEYDSAAALIERLERRMSQWREQIPEDAQPVMLATIPQVGAIRVMRLVADGHNGVIVIGESDGKEFMFLTHQANLQLLCYVEKVEEEEKRNPPIGFVR